MEAAVEDFNYKVRWDRLGRKGEKCKVISLPNSTRNTSYQAVYVEFEDGKKFMIDRQALKRL